MISGCNFERRTLIKKVEAFNKSRNKFWINQPFMQPRKGLGQHFLTDGNIADKIVAVLKVKSDAPVLEIGPGTGALTGRLISRFRDFCAIEVDERAIEQLRSIHPNIVLFHEDILRFDWNKLYEKKGRLSVIGNLPYYITSPILFAVLDRSRFFNKAVFMIQKEVAERLTAIPRTKAYGILSVQTQALAKVTYEFTVSRNVFFPKPKVESGVISLDFLHPDLPCRFENFKKVVRTAFNQRRKQLKNGLGAIIGAGVDIDFDLTRRPEELSPMEFINLTVLLEEKRLLSG